MQPQFTFKQIMPSLNVLQHTSTLTIWITVHQQMPPRTAFLNTGTMFRKPNTYPKEQHLPMKTMKNIPFNTNPQEQCTADPIHTLKNNNRQYKPSRTTFANANPFQHKPSRTTFFKANPQEQCTQPLLFQYYIYIYILTIAFLHFALLLHFIFILVIECAFIFLLVQFCNISV